MPGASHWTALLDLDDLPARSPRALKPQRTVAEALAFHRAESRRQEREQRTHARLMGTAGLDGAAEGAGAGMLPPALAALQVVDRASDASRSTTATTVRRTPGPPPPKSWTSPLPSSAASSRSHTTFTASTAAQLPVEIDHFTRSHLSSLVELHASRRSRGPPRLLVSALLLLLARLETAPDQEEAREQVAALPRHLREVAVWGVPNWLGRGLSAREVEALLWDLRDWGEEEDGAVCDGAPERADTDGGEDSWDSSSSSSASSSSSGSGAGWPTLYLPCTSLPPSTLRLLLTPNPAGLASPITHLSLAYAALPLERLLPVLPAHLRALSLAGVRLLPAGEDVIGGSARVRSLLIRLARATPLLRDLDLSHAHPPLTPALLAEVPWSTQWRALDTLVLTGLDRVGLKAREAQAEVRRGMGKGRGWCEVVVE